MAPSSKADKKAVLDVASWMFNVATSVGNIIVNKALMATYGFSFATTLTGLHFATTTLMTFVLRWLGHIQPSHLPLPELVKFVLFANFSIVGMNVSFMRNSVGFYQIAKLSMIPASCFLEVIFDKIQYSRDTKLSITLVLLGVAVCTVTDYVHFLQQKYSLGSFNLLGHTAPAQAASILVLGPFLDYWLTKKRVDAYENLSFGMTSSWIGVCQRFERLEDGDRFERLEVESSNGNLIFFRFTNSGQLVNLKYI